MPDLLARALDDALSTVRAAPRQVGRLELIVRRPEIGEREVVETASLDPDQGLVGDDWQARARRHQPDGTLDPATQLTLMSVRVLAAIEPDRARWPLAGDQLLVDLDLSTANLPAGTRLRIEPGDVEVEISDVPHTGCAKFGARFGIDALRWINGREGRALRMRGVNARVIRGGSIRAGDEIRRA